MNERMNPRPYLDWGASLSDCGRFRYLLWRKWDSTGDTLAVVMLNPSTADACDDDPTIRKVVGFAKRAKFGRVEVLNLFALRATDPKVLIREAGDRFGPNNFKYLERHAQGRDVLVGWGANVEHRSLFASHHSARAWLKKASPRSVSCLGTTSGGFPRHPLMVAYETKWEAFAL